MSQRTKEQISKQVCISYVISRPKISLFCSRLIISAVTDPGALIVGSFLRHLGPLGSSSGEGTCSSWMPMWSNCLRPMCGGPAGKCSLKNKHGFLVCCISLFLCTSTSVIWQKKILSKSQISRNMHGSNLLLRYNKKLDALVSEWNTFVAQ